ncbi:helix-turn-helix domain-containing protein [Tomitella biformata]|uniref:helix-turn-helix domain-containing protein n=1 Tax=Tomitella biformata TaxID=630403 RepID=UPI0004678033|nr:helix-turn-helix transcriptional regulator [Tomitella biformata]
MRVAGDRGGQDLAANELAECKGRIVLRADLDGFLADLRTVVGDVARLTPRQREVLALVAEGRSNAWIAARLVISEKAVVQHTSHIYDALGIQMDSNDHRRVMAVVRYLAG